MTGPDDRLLQRLAEALSAPADEPEEADLRRLRSALVRWRHAAFGADPAARHEVEAAGRPAHVEGRACPGADSLDVPPVLAPLIFRPPRTSGS